MTVQNSATLKGYFEVGDKPTQSQFVDLIDTVFRPIDPVNPPNSFIKDLSSTPPALDDYLAIAETSDSGNAKKTLISDLRALFSLPNSFIKDLSSTPPALDDYLAIAETSDSGNAKKTLISDLATLLNKPLFQAIEAQASGSNAGTFTAAAWRTRGLNAVQTNAITGSSLVSSTITLPAGTYYANFSAPVVGVQWHKVRLRNVTDSITLLVGTSEFAANAVPVANRSFGSGLFTLSAAKQITIEHFCSQTVATYGFGYASSVSEIEVYTDIKIWKIS